MQEFLAARNPKQQHSSTLESYLIKPIQRILKYPLLLQQLKNLSDPQAEEHLHLIGEWGRVYLLVRVPYLIMPCINSINPQRHSRGWRRWPSTSTKCNGSTRSMAPSLTTSSGNIRRRANNRLIYPRVSSQINSSMMVELNDGHD